MPLLVAAAVVLGMVAVFTAMVPLSLVLRYRAGTARRLARGWVATLNVVGIGLSAGLFLAAAAFTTLWVPRALPYSAAGMAAGCLLGVLGLWLSRWETLPRSVHYTPNRWLVLAITLVVTSRLFYGLWRAWNAWRTTPDDTSWLAAAGVAGSLAAGAVVLGYYLAYWTGLWFRLRRHRRQWTAGGRLSPR
jgi:hypothetical protein